MPSSAKVPVLVVSLTLLFLSGPASIAAFSYNLGSVQLVRGLVSPETALCVFESSREWFDLSNKVGGSAQFDLSYGSELACLAALDPLANPYHLDLEDWSRSERGQMLRKAVIQLVLRRADEAHHEGQAAEEKAWRILAVELQPGNADQRKQLAVWLASEHGNIAEAIAQYEMAVEKIEEPTYQDYLRLVALNLKVRRLEQATYWHDQLRQHFSDTSYAWLHDLQGSVAAQLALAAAYAYFGLLDDAIQSLRNSLDKGVERTALLFNLGVLHHRDHQYDRSIQAFQSTVQDKEYGLGSHHALGLAYSAAGQPDVALDHLMTVMKTIDLRLVSSDQIEQVNHNYQELLNIYLGKGRRVLPCLMN